mmetsp:Transcript_122711/g.192615  ORF Transcript_122711/g.192615 Transcript_122711/m.192615 type:complete len:240 (-) Transcript_122711:320-1039(-)
MDSTLLAADQAVWSPTTLHELAQEIAEWRTQEDVTQGNSTLSGMNQHSSQLEERNRWLQGVVQKLLTLWKIASQRQLSLLEENSKLVWRLESVSILQQMSVYNARISQSLAHDLDSPLPHSIVNDVRSLEILTTNLAHLARQRQTDLSPSFSSSGSFAFATTRGLLTTPPGFDKPLAIPDVINMALQTRPHFESCPSRQSPSVPTREAPASQEIPMPRFAMSQALEFLEQDPGAVWPTL